MPYWTSGICYILLIQLLSSEAIESLLILLFSRFYLCINYFPMQFPIRFNQLEHHSLIIYYEKQDHISFLLKSNKSIIISKHQTASQLLQLKQMIRFCAFFSTNTKNYVNQFKVRSRLAEFFKHIHPDQMAQAPTKIKDENLRSLKNFNAYLDTINQQKPIQGKLLKFYISEKSNNKSRKFFSFNLELPQLNAEQAKMNEEKAGKLIDDIVTALNNKFKQSRGILQGKKKEKIVVQNQIKVQTEQQKIKRMQETVGPFQRSNFKKYMEEETLRHAINSKFMQAQKQDLKLKLRKNMSFANTSTNKPMMWSRILMEQSGIYSDYQQILNHLIDPKLIYFSEDIGLSEIEQFKKKLLPGQLDRLGVRATQAVIQVCQQMESYSPPISLFVTNHYSATDIPGFFSIPYNFKPAELLQNFQQCKHLILEERAKYQQYYDSYEQLVKQLLANNKWKVQPMDFKNNSDINGKIIALKRLTKYKLKRQTHFYLYQHEDFRIFCKEYKLPEQSTVHLFNGKLFALRAFKQEEMSQLIANLCQQKESQSH